MQKPTTAKTAVHIETNFNCRMSLLLWNITLHTDDERLKSRGCGQVTYHQETRDPQLAASSLDSFEFRHGVCVLCWPLGFPAVPHYFILGRLTIAPSQNRTGADSSYSGGSSTRLSSNHFQYARAMVCSAFAMPSGTSVPGSPLYAPSVLVQILREALRHSDKI